MQGVYGRDLDLNLLRVFLVVADAGSVTSAAARLYLTQPAVSAALSRLGRAVGAPLFVRQGRRLVLSSRGAALRGKVQLHLAALVDAALAPQVFEPTTSERVVRLGLSDAAEAWLLPRLLRLLSERAPRLRVIAVPVQFRTVGEALARARVDLAVTVADTLPSAVHRQTLLDSDLVCLFDRRHVKVGKQLTEAAYFAREHVIVSYNEDLRGVVEDALAKPRSVRCSVSSFANVPEIVEGSPLFGTVPRLIAMDAARRRAALDFRRLPFALPSAPTDLLWPAAADDDDACRFVRGLLLELGAEVSRRLPKHLK